MTKKVSIEIGHGGADFGARHENINEKDINLVVGLELKRQLERHSVNVLINRTTDVGFRIRDFLEKAEEFKPDVGISIHTNTYNGRARGFEIFRNTNAFKLTSNLLCALIEKEVKALGRISRGIKDSPFMMSTLQCPTAFCELGFLDNPSDYLRFNTITKQKATAIAYAKGILEYLSIDWIEEIEEMTKCKVCGAEFEIYPGISGYQRKMYFNGDGCPECMPKSIEY